MGSVNFNAPASSAKQRSLVEGKTDLETAASQTAFRTSADRVSQWKSWQKQVEDKDSEIFADGSTTCTFKDVMMIGQALEITLQRCLEAPFPGKSDLESYANLLIATQPNFMKFEVLDALLSSLVQLGKLLPSFASRSDVKDRAQKAVAAAVKLLKEQEPGDSTDSVQSFNSDLPDQAAAQAQELENMGKAMSSQHPSAQKDQTDKIHKALELSKEHLQLFSQDSPMHETKAGFAVEALDVLVQDLSGSEALSGKNESRIANGDKHNEDNEELSLTKSNILDCERQLERLRKTEQELEARAHPGKASSQAQQANGIAPHATQEQLDCLQALRECIISNQSPYRNPSGLSAQGLSEGQLSEAGQYFLTNLEQLLHVNMHSLQEMAPRVQEVALRLSRAIKTGRDLQDPVVNATQEQIAKNRQHQQTYQKQLQDYIASAERALRKSKLEFGDLNYYKVQLQLIWSKEVVQNWVAAFTNVLTETQKAYDVVMDASKNKGQAQSQRATPDVSLSHADPVVQPHSSPAGAIGSSAKGRAQDDGIANGSVSSEAVRGHPKDQRGVNGGSHQQPGTGSGAGQAGFANGQHDNNQPDSFEQAKGRRKNRGRRE